MWLDDVLEDAERGQELAPEQLLRLLALPPASREAGRLRLCADQLTRAQAGSEGMIGAQIGLDARPCSGACAFCAFSASHGSQEEHWRISDAELVAEARALVAAGANYISLMATADLPFDEYLRLSALARAEMPDAMLLSANIGDFDREQARQLVALGYGRVYHVLRLGEGVHTALDPAERLASIAAASAEGLEIAFCIEPVGPEHTDDELLDRILISRQVEPTMAAVMRRIPFPGSPFADSGAVSELRMAQIMAVTRLAHVGHRARTFYIHEPSLLGLVAGANLICAERAGNPREGNHAVDTARGLSVHQCRRFLSEAGFSRREAANYPGSWFAGYDPKAKPCVSP